MFSKRSTQIDWSHLSLFVVGVLLGVMITAWTQKGFIKSLHIKHALLQMHVEQFIAQLDEHDDKLGDAEWAIELRRTKELINSKIRNTQ
jgi:hypothetical protein